MCVKKRVKINAILDITSCATFNPVYPVIATCSGQRKFALPKDSSDEEDEEDEEDMDKDVIIDNTIKTWRVPGQYEWYAYPLQAEEMVADDVYAVHAVAAVDASHANVDQHPAAIDVENGTVITTTIEETTLETITTTS